VEGGFTERPEQVKRLAFCAVDEEPVGVFPTEADLLPNGDLLT